MSDPFEILPSTLSLSFVFVSLEFELFPFMALAAPTIAFPIPAPDLFPAECVEKPAAPLMAPEVAPPIAPKPTAETLLAADLALFIKLPDLPVFSVLLPPPGDPGIFDPQKALDPFDEDFDWKALDESPVMDNKEDMIRESKEKDEYRLENREKL